MATGWLIYTDEGDPSLPLNILQNTTVFELPFDANTYMMNYLLHSGLVSDAGIGLLHNHLRLNKYTQPDEFLINLVDILDESGVEHHLEEDFPFIIGMTFINSDPDRRRY